LVAHGGDPEGHIYHAPNDRRDQRDQKQTSGRMHVETTPDPADAGGGGGQNKRYVRGRSQKACLNPKVDDVVVRSCYALS